MSLTTLISIVEKRISSIDEKVIIDLLDIISNEDIFTEEIIYNNSVSDINCHTFLEILSGENVIESMFRYECEIEGDDLEIASSLQENCMYCMQSIENNAHIVKKVYRLNNNDLPSLIEKHIDEGMERFVGREYISSLKRLKKKIREVVPFLGSGISIPLGLPNWIGLIRELEEELYDEDLKQFNNYLDAGDIFNALDLLVESSIVYSEKEIKSFIKEYINENMKKDLDEKYHNIVDILNLNSDFYITTNYDNALTFYKDKFSTSPFVLDDLTDMQELNEEKNNRIIHIHGNVERKESLIVTNSDYKKVYESEKNKYIMSGIMTQKPFLFIGFSFTDKYFIDLYTLLQRNIGGNHFIILPDLHRHQVKSLREIGLIPISIKVNDSQYTKQHEITDEYTQKFVHSLKHVINYLIR